MRMTGLVCEGGLHADTLKVYEEPILGSVPRTDPQKRSENNGGDSGDR